MSPRATAASLSLALFVAACGGADGSAPQVATPLPPATVAPPPPPPQPLDVLGPPPLLVTTPPFQPPAPAVYTLANGLTVWLLERHALPLVGVTVIVPTGSSSDPEGKAGLADQATEILNEGAGSRGALELARAVDDLGATLHADASRDSSHVHLGVVKRNFPPAMQLLGDVVVRPRLDAVEWRRQHDLWLNALKERASDPEAVAGVVESAVLYGGRHPYGHPVEGLSSTAPGVQLEDAKRFHAQAWRPDQATVVVVGDVTRGELDAQLEAAFGAWKSPSTPTLPVITPPPPDSIPSAGAPAKARIVLVDRADASQAVVALIRPGLDASDPRYPPLYRANIALGGSFSSRLMQDLREAHGWTYGAASRVTPQRGVGTISAGASVVTEKTVDAVGAMLRDVDDFARAGLTEDEVSKTRSCARSEIVNEYQTVAHTSFALAQDAALGLGPTYEAKSSALSDEATRDDLNKLAATFFDRAGATVVVVGPRAKLEGPLVQAGYGPIEHRDAEGRPVAAPKTPPKSDKGAK